MRVYGNQIEPGGMLLENEAHEIECTECGGTAKFRTWEACEGGSIDSYYSMSCACGYFETDDGDSLEIDE